MQVYDGMMKFPLENLVRQLQNSQQPTTSRDDLLCIMRKVGDDITMVATMLHVFAFRYERNSAVVVATESLQADCKMPKEILSILTKVWPNVETAISKWGDDEVRQRAV